MDLSHSHFVCAAFRNRIKIQRTNRFIRSCISPCCTGWPLLSLPISKRVCEPVQLPMQPAAGVYSGSNKSTLPCCLSKSYPAGHRAQLLSAERKSRDQLKPFCLILTAKDKPDSLACTVTTALPHQASLVDRIQAQRGDLQHVI